MVKLFKIYNNSEPNSELKIIGSGPELKKIKSIIFYYGLKNKIKIIEENYDIEKYYITSDIYLSTSKSEGFGNVFIEANYYNLPIISFDNGGISDIIQKTHQGFIVKNNSVYSYIENMKRYSKKKYFIEPSTKKYSREKIYSRYLNFIMGKND